MSLHIWINVLIVSLHIWLNVLIMSLHVWLNVLIMPLHIWLNIESKFFRARTSASLDSELSPRALWRLASTSCGRAGLCFLCSSQHRLVPSPSPRPHHHHHQVPSPHWRSPTSFVLSLMLDSYRLFLVHLFTFLPTCDIVFLLYTPFSPQA